MFRNDDQRKFTPCQSECFVYSYDAGRAFQVLYWQVEHDSIMPWVFAGGTFTRLDGCEPTEAGEAAYRAEVERINRMEPEDFVIGSPVEFRDAEDDWDSGAYFMTMR